MPLSWVKSQIEGIVHANVQICTCTAVMNTFDITPSPPPTVSTATGGGVNSEHVVLILTGGGAVVAVCTSLFLPGLACCMVWRQKKKRRKDKVTKVKKVNSFSQLPRLQPTVKVMDSLTSVCMAQSNEFQERIEGENQLLQLLTPSCKCFSLFIFAVTSPSQVFCIISWCSRKGAEHTCGVCV